MRTNLIINKIEEVPIENKETKVVGEVPNALDMVIAFDTTGSMKNYIEGVKKYIIELVDTLFTYNSNLKLSLVAFGDYCDMEEANVFGKAFQKLDFTSNKEAIIDFVKNAKNTHGGDADEFYELVLHKIINEFNWRKDSTKSILLVADSRFHPVGYVYDGHFSPKIVNTIDMKDVIKQAIINNIKVDTLSINNQVWLKDIAQQTNGVITDFTDAGNYKEVITAATLLRTDTSYTKTILREKMASAVKNKDADLTSIYSCYTKHIKD